MTLGTKVVFLSYCGNVNSWHLQPIHCEDREEFCHCEDRGKLKFTGTGVCGWCFETQDPHNLRDFYMYVSRFARKSFHVVYNAVWTLPLATMCSIFACTICEHLHVLCERGLSFQWKRRKLEFNWTSRLRGPNLSVLWFLCHLLIKFWNRYPNAHMWMCSCALL